MSDILVGVDPRDLSIQALVWAADEAVRRGATLRLIAAVPPVHDRLRYDALAHESSLRIRAESTLANAQDLVRELHDGLWTVTELVDGVPATILRDRTRGAALAVVGSRRLGRAAEVLSEGSVAVPLAARADCPVVVIREPEHTAVHPPLIVVGVDGSKDCRAAVAFAAAEASLRDARLMAVWVWPRPLLSRDDDAEGLADRRRLLAESVAGFAERHPDVQVEQVITRGHPVEALTRASQDALAVVVGRRGRGGYSGMRIGSTVHGLLHHAACPVITVPLPEAGGTLDAAPGAEGRAARGAGAGRAADAGRALWRATPQVCEPSGASRVPHGPIGPLPARPVRPSRTAPMGTAPCEGSAGG
ncbi:universal stress protein [Streptomyces sp. NPDC015661]|uniref:universal stress protein n=1 Tax=Streptomyces sp. NPDC015661 TaxID=3364961 RepID=UPI0036FCD499